MNSFNFFKKYFIFIIFSFSVLYAIDALAAPDVIGDLDLLSNPNNSIYSPINLNHEPEVLISRGVYLISYNPQKRLLNWAAWKIDSSDLGHVGRTNNFQADPDLQSYLEKNNQAAVISEDYTGSCFDRGHQVPSADRDTSTSVNQLTFYMSNMIPQTAYLNRVVWEHLENYTRQLVATQNKKVYVIAGPIYDEDFGKIGINQDIPVPSKDFKVVIAIDQNQNFNDPNVKPEVISVIMPNILKNGEKPNQDRLELCNESKNLTIGPGVGKTMNYDDWKAYAAPLSEIEKLSGFRIQNLQ